MLTLNLSFKTCMYEEKKATLAALWGGSPPCRHHVNVSRKSNLNTTDLCLHCSATFVSCVREKGTCKMKILYPWSHQWAYTKSMIYMQEVSEAIFAKSWSIKSTKHGWLWFHTALQVLNIRSSRMTGQHTMFDRNVNGNGSWRCSVLARSSSVPGLARDFITKEAKTNSL